MSRADGGLRKLLRDHLKKPDWRFTPIETGGTHNGVPDCFFLHRPTKSHGWIECKYTDGWAVKVEPHQVEFLELHSAADVPCWIAVRVSGAGSAGGRGDGLWLLPGSAAGLLAREGLRGVRDAGQWLLVAQGEPRHWDWGSVTSELTKYGDWR